jgi:hypothetical protein
LGWQFTQRLLERWDQAFFYDQAAEPWLFLGFRHAAA